MPLSLKPKDESPTSPFPFPTALCFPQEVISKGRLLARCPWQPPAMPCSWRCVAMAWSSCPELGWDGAGLRSPKAHQLQPIPVTNPSLIGHQAFKCRRVAKEGSSVRKWWPEKAPSSSPVPGAPRSTQVVAARALLPRPVSLRRGHHHYHVTTTATTTTTMPPPLPPPAPPQPEAWGCFQHLHDRLHQPQHWPNALHCP